MAKLSDEQRKAAAEIFGEDFVKSLEEEGERRTKELEEAGVAFKEGDKWAKARAALKEAADDAEGEALAKALKKMADELDDEGAVKSAKQLRSTAKKMGGDMAERLRKIAGMLSPDSEEDDTEDEEEKPEAKKEQPDLSLLVEQVTAAVAAKIDPVSQSLADLAGRIEALERGEAQKAALTPRRASRSDETAVSDDDPLMAMKTRENERREGTLANAFFPKK
jgi:ABC-type phosphate transport system auxiliary subunit